MVKFVGENEACGRCFRPVCRGAFLLRYLGLRECHWNLLNSFTAGNICTAWFSHKWCKLGGTLQVVIVWYLNDTPPIEQPRGLLIQGWHYIIIELCFCWLMFWLFSHAGAVPRGVWKNSRDNAPDETSWRFWVEDSGFAQPCAEIWKATLRFSFFQRALHVGFLEVIRWLFPIGHWDFRSPRARRNCRCRDLAPGLGRIDRREQKSEVPWTRQIPSRHTGWPGAAPTGAVVVQGDASGAETIGHAIFLSVKGDVCLKWIKVTFKVK